jgi:HEPN domain-containing protein
MVDISKVVAHWRIGAREDWDVATDLVARGRPRHGLFFGHLALDKALKARVSEITGQLAPRLHDLLRLAEAAGLGLEAGRRDTLARMSAYALAGRYPDSVGASLAAEDAQARLAEAKEVFEWLMKPPST